VTNVRRLTLAVVIAGAIIGGFVKIATGSFTAPGYYEIDFSTLPEKIDQFHIEGRGEKDGSLRVRFARCEQPIFVNAFLIRHDSSQALSELLYPPNRWRSLYVYRGHSYDSFARIPAYLRLVALRSLEAITVSARDFSYEHYFAFRVPVECAIDANSAISASNTMLRSAVTVRY